METQKIDPQEKLLLDSLTEIIRNNDNAPDIDKIENYRALGGGYLYLGEFDKVISIMNEAIKTTSDNAELAILYNMRGAAYSEKKDFAHAIEDFTKVIESAPEQDSPYYNRGLIYLFDNKDYDKAIADFEQVIKLSPQENLLNESNTYYNLGQAYFEKEDYENARKNLLECLRLDPHYQGAQSLLYHINNNR